MKGYIYDSQCLCRRLFIANLSLSMEFVVKQTFTAFDCHRSRVLTSSRERSAAIVVLTMSCWKEWSEYFEELETSVLKSEEMIFSENQCLLKNSIKRANSESELGLEYFWNKQYKA